MTRRVRARVPPLPPRVARLCVTHCGPRPDTTHRSHNTPCSYGIRGTAPASDLARALRGELYTQPYESIAWDAQRNNCASIDLYAPHTVGGHRGGAVAVRALARVRVVRFAALRAKGVMVCPSRPDRLSSLARACPCRVQWFVEAAFWCFRAYENWAPRFLFKWLRAKGLAFALEYIHAEDLQTNFIDIGPVNKVRAGVGLRMAVAACAGVARAVPERQWRSAPCALSRRSSARCSLRVCARASAGHQHALRVLCVRQGRPALRAPQGAHRRLPVGRRGE